MKRLFILVPIVLASCAPAMIPPASSVSGYWTGSLSKYGLSATISARLNVTNSPNAGDFTGTGKVRGIVSIDNATVTGNVNAGTLIAQSGSDVVTCKGTFKNNNEFNGDCSYGAYSAPFYMSRQGD